MLAYVNWSWWLPVTTSAYLAIAAIWVFRRTKRWPLCVFFAATCLVLLASVFSVFVKPIVVNFPRNPEGFAKEIAELFSVEPQINNWTKLSRFTHWLAYPLAAVGALGMIANLRRKPATESATDQPQPDTKNTRNRQMEAGYGKRLPIIVCVSLCVQLVISLGSDWDGLLSGRLPLSGLLPVLGFIFATIATLVLVIRTPRISILTVIATLIVGLGFLLTPEGVENFLTVAACIVGLTASILLITKGKKWLALGMGGVIVSLMILFPDPHYFL